MLNLQYLFLEMNKSKIQVFVKSLPTILKNVTDHHLFSEGFLSEWQKGAIKDIEKNFLYNAGRDV